MAGGVVIIGNSGAARECYWNALDMLGDSFRFRGFLAYEGFPGELKELSGLEIGSDESFTPRPDDVFVIGIGSPELRSRAFAKWKARGARFLTLIHPVSFLSPGTVMGEGNIVACSCYVSCNVEIGSANFLNGSVTLGHDARVGDANFFGTFSLILGGATIGSQNAFGVRSTVLPGAKIGDGNTIAPGAFIYKGCGNGRLMAGNPALDMGRLDHEPA